MHARCCCCCQFVCQQLSLQWPMCFLVSLLPLLPLLVLVLALVLCQ
jgi:hypothetical protein